MKVDELTGAELDKAVCRAEGIEYKEANTSSYVAYLYTKNDETVIDWNFAGKIIERDWQLIIDAMDAEKKLDNEYDLLTAIKRCIVKLKYGETIPEVKE